MKPHQLINQDSGLDFTVEEMEDGTFEVWTPDIHGACIGQGAIRDEAIHQTKSNLIALLCEMSNQPMTFKDALELVLREATARANGHEHALKILEAVEIVRDQNLK